MKKLLLSLFCFVCCVGLSVARDKNLIVITAQPQEASIYVNNTFLGYGYGEFMKPKKKDDVAIIRIECEEYKPIFTKFYGADKRKNISYSLVQDGFYRASAASGLVNKFFTVTIDPRYYSVEGEKVNLAPAWKLLHQILLNYFDEIATTDFYGGYLQTPWQFKTFTMSEKKIRNRVTVRDISTPDRVAFQIKLTSEVAGSHAARNGEFTEVDRLPKELEPLLEELQTRIGKMSSL